MKLGYQDILALPDEVYHVYVDSMFKVIGKQVGMGSVGYDFSEKQQKTISDFLNFSGDYKNDS